MKILLVDDEETIVRGIRHHLEQLPNLQLEIACAYSGLEALEAMEYFRPELMIVDIRMPDMSGLELIEKIHSRYFCPNIIILSAYKSFEYAQQAIEAKVLRYLCKPVSYEILDRMILDMVKKSERQLDIPHILQQYGKLFPHIEIQPVSASLKNIVEHIQQNYAQSLSLAQLSQTFHLSESGICLLFKREMASSFVEYLSEWRMKKAMELLLGDPSLRVDQIAYRVGYQTNRQLFRLFQKKLGISPISFREQWLGNTAHQS